jgi:2',3'-cyclic-nucleotide 2'-phosphodiesterase (5'-nucleotidase family)
MIKKLFFVAGAGVGYLLGTRAGREKYDKMVAKAREVMDRPDVQEVTGAVKAKANQLYDEGRQRVRATIGDAPAPTRDSSIDVVGPSRIDTPATLPPG